MRPTPIPAGWIDRYLPGGRAQVIAPPDGDLMNPDIAAVEMVVGGFASGPTFSALCTPEDDDLPRLSAGGLVLVTFWGQHLHPFAVQVVDR